MLFHTWTFALFFLIVYPVFLAVRHSRFRIPWLLFASYLFYGWWNPLYLLLILWSTTVDYVAVVFMSKSTCKRRWLALSILSNLGLLGFFKYGPFLVTNANAFLGWLRVPLTVPAPNIEFLSGGLNVVLERVGIPFTVPPLPFLLPVGISFFVFQSMSYTIDCYRGRIGKEPSFIRYATFVSLFPQLVAGPIERASNLLPQLREPPCISRTDIGDGLSLFVVGLFKKVALADYLARYVDRVYAFPEQFGAPALILATVAFGWQIYFDFSGYTDMARGIGRMMGIRLMLNFRNPYLATGLGDFWQRWHISLSTWFKDYVYIPLGGNRKGEARTYVNMCLTMLISGLWHGASWTFVIWGALHALGRVLTRDLETTQFYRQRVPVFAKRVLVFAFVSFAWIFFRAQSPGDAWTIITRIASLAPGDPAMPLLAMALMAAVWLYQALYESRLRSLLRPAPVRIALVVLMLVYMVLFTGSSNQPFIYFQF